MLFPQLFDPQTSTYTYPIELMGNLNLPKLFPLINFVTK